MSKFEMSSSNSLSISLPAWEEKALCGAYDPELFYPDNVYGPANIQIREAKAVCERCDVKTQCLQYALENNEVWGIWGGTSPKDRELLKKRKR